jgi:hypothetical protein
MIRQVRGEFVAFPVEEIEQSISDRFEQRVDRFPSGSRSRQVLSS